MKPYVQCITVFWVLKFAHFIVMLSLLKLYLFSCNFAPCRHFWSVIFMSVIFSQPNTGTPLLFLCRQVPNCHNIRHQRRQFPFTPLYQRTWEIRDVIGQVVRYVMRPHSCGAVSISDICHTSLCTQMRSVSGSRATHSVTLSHCIA